jgi:hypothetical protein
MATFREIDEQILALVDEEGEILDVEAFEALAMERTAKIVSMVNWVMDVRDDQTALANEISRLKDLLDKAKRKEERLKEFITAILGGEKLKTPTCSVSYRSSSAVEISDENAVRGFAELNGYDDILKFREPEISKTELKRLISEGVEVPGAAIVSRVSTIIK